ncbi:MAG: hypothetical protein JWP92_433 [Caulobacter sp.]|nr:hypothetical protein [Caulobacter sp.]
MALYNDHSHHHRPKVEPAQSALCAATCVAGLVIAAMALQWVFGLIF